ncbi:hypothetical protein KXR64_22555 [Brucella intermedia]|uniref:hypothetical protein n=1 Tax=Brucella TaxID=234 RepID=UPI0009462609|nr:hypothetical protein [Brucella intermedia]
MEVILAQLIGGVVGGSAGGRTMQSPNLGGLGNAIAGAIGGVGGGQLLGSLMGINATPPAGFDIVTLAGQVVCGGIAGLVVQIAAGLIKNKIFGPNAV